MIYDSFCSILGISDRGLGFLRSLHNLQAMTLSHNHVTDQGIRRLFSSPAFSNSLKELRMDHCKLITDQAIEIVLEHCKTLEIFIFHGCEQTTLRSLDTLGNFLSTRTSVMKQITFVI